MEGSLVVLMAVVVLVVVAVFPPIRSSKDRQRSQRLVAFAQSKGWHYDHERPELVDRFEGAPFVEGRSNARARHVLCTQMRGHRVLAFEYTYSFGPAGRSVETVLHTHTVVTVAVPGNTPVVEVRSVKDPGAAPVHGSRVGTGEERFDEVFRVWSTDPGFAESVLGEEVRALLLGHPSGYVPLRLAGAHAVSWEPRQLEAEFVQMRASAMVDLLKCVPGRVWQAMPG